LITIRHVIYCALNGLRYTNRLRIYNAYIIWLLSMIDLGYNPLFATTIFLLGIVFRIRSVKKIDPLDPFLIVSLLCILTFVSRPIGLTYGLTGYLKNVSREVLLLGIWYGVFFYLFFLCGYYFAIKSKFNIWRSSMVGVYIISGERRGNANAMTLLVVLIFLSIAIGLVATHGGVSYVMENRATVYRGAGPLVAMLYLGLIGGLVLFVLWLYNRVGSLYFFTVTTIISLALLLSTGERLRILEMILGMIVVYHYNIKRLSLSKGAIIGVIVITILTAMLFYRRYYVSGSIGDEGLDFELMDSLLRNFLMFDGFVAVIERVPSEMDYSYGAGYFFAILGFIPRVIWPDKPAWGKEVFTQTVFGVDDSVFTYGLVGEFWWNFGAYGVVVGGLLYGFLLGLLYKYVIRNSQDPMKVIMYFLLMSSLVLRGFKGGMESAFMEIVIKIFMLYFTVLIITQFRVRVRLHKYKK